MANDTANLRNYSTAPPPEDRLNSWKEIAAYLKCSERTVRRWEQEGLPVHRHPHKAKAAIYAYKAEIDAWWRDGHEPVKQARGFQQPHAVVARWWTRPRARLVGALALALVSVVLFVGVGRRFHWFQPGPRNAQIRSIAVLPLVNLSGDPQQEYFADGMTDELITELAQLKEIRVISRTSVMRFKGAKTPLPQIGRELQVDVVVEGSVIRAGTRVRISAQLLEAAGDRHLWAKNYERDVNDVLGLQRELARAIAAEIKIKLTPRESARLETFQPINSEAQINYLKSRYFIHNQRTPEGARKAVECSVQAVQSAPDWALAYSALAESYATAAFLSAIPPNEAMPKAESAARKALQLDPDLSEAHTALAWVLSNFYFDYASGEREFKGAIELGPSSSDAHQGYADLLNGLGRADEAISQIKLARQLDPMSFYVSRDVGRILYDSKRYDEALEALREAAEMNPSSGVVYNWMSWAYDKKGMTAKSVEMDLRSAGNRGASQEVLQQLREAYRVSGERGYLRKHLELIQGDPYEQALYTARLGETQKAFQLLREACAQHSGWLDMLKVDPELDNLRPDRRFTELLHRINLSR
jgi:TolB-like protein/Flp pilus assembly protein TadD